MAAISEGWAPAAADCDTARIVASRMEATPPDERPYCPFAARWVPAKPGCAASALTGTSAARQRRSSSRVKSRFASFERAYAAHGRCRPPSARGSSNGARRAIRWKCEATVTTRPAPLSTS